MIHEALLAALMQKCAPSTDVRTMAAIIAVESNGDSWAVRDPDSATGVHPTSYSAAVSLAHGLLMHGHRVALGLSQVLLPRRGLDSATMLGSPCANVRAGAAVLADFYGREIDHSVAPNTSLGQQTALRRALSAYNSGSPVGAPEYTALVLGALQSPFVTRITAIADGRLALTPVATTTPASLQIAPVVLGVPRDAIKLPRIASPVVRHPRTSSLFFSDGSK